MNDINRRMISHGGIYLLGNVLHRSVSFIMLPIYMNYLTPADYGVLALLSTVIDLMAILLGMRIAQAIFRFYNEYAEEQQKRSVISTAMVLVGGLNLCGILVIVALGKPISLLVFNDAESVRLLVLFSFTLLFQGLIEVPMVFLRARQKPVLYVAFSTLKLLLQLSLNIYFIVILGMKVEGVVYSSVLSGIVMCCIMVFYTLKITGVGFSGSIARELANFSLPLVLTGIVSFFITFGDRFFLSYYSDLSEVGIYSLAYKFGFLLMFMIVEPFSNHWDSEKYTIAKAPGARRIYQQTFLVYSTLVILFVVVVSVFIKDLLRILANPSFWAAYTIVPVVMLAYIFNAWAYYTNLGIFLKKRTIEITYGTLIGAVVAGIGYFTLIPAYGSQGAAWATVFGFASRFLWISRRSEKLYNMELPWGKVLVLLLFGIATCVLSWIGPDNLIPSLIVNCLITLAFIGVVLLTPILPETLRRSILKVILKPWKLPSMIKGTAGSTPH